MALTIPTYVKNLGKSLGYIGADVFTSYAPTMSSLAKTTKEATQNTYQAIKDFTSSSSSSDFSFKGITEKGGELASNIWKNTIDDIKTGKIYNKERQEALNNEMMKSLGFDFDFDFDLDDWGDNEDISDSDDVAKAQVSAQLEGSKAIINAVDAMGRGMTASINNATVESASYIAASAKEDSLALFNLNKAGYASINKALMSVNETIYNFSKIGEPLTAHMQNSYSFFAKAETSLNNIEQSLKQIEKNTTPITAVGSRSSKRKRSLSDAFTDEGIDFGELRDTIKESVDEWKELASMFGGVGKGGIGNGKNISLAGMISKGIVEAFIPGDFKRSIKGLDKSLKYGLQAGLAKVAGGNSGNFLIDTLAGLFLPGIDRTRKISTKFEKGPVAWDGIARKALVDVIPTTLLEIYSALTGAPSQRYDYNSGKFIKVSSIADKFNEEKRKHVRNSAEDFFDAMEKKLASRKGMSKDKKDKMMEEAYKYFEQAFDTGDYNIFTQNHGIDPEAYKIIRNIAIKSLRNKNDGTLLNATVAQSAKANAEYAALLQSLGAAGDSMYTMGAGFSGKTKGRGLIGLDEYGHDYYFYLQGIWQYTNFLANNVGFIAGVTNEQTEAANLNTRVMPGIPTNIKQSGERTTEESNKHIFIADDDEPDEKEIKKSKVEKLLKGLTERTKNVVNGIFGTNLTTGQLVSVQIMDSISDSINRMIFGNRDDGSDGLIGYMMNRTKDLFDNAKNWFKENIFDRFKNWFKEKVGDKWNNSEWVQSTKERLGQIKDSALGSVRKVFIGDQTDNGTAAYGRKVTKTGIVTVSEGELIIPSEYNPFYHGATNKASQIANEMRISGGRYPMYADGNEGEYQRYFTKDGKPAHQGKNGKWYATGVKGSIKASDIIDKGESPKTSLRDKVSDNSIFGILFHAADGVFDKAKEVTNEIFNKDKIKKDEKKFSDKIGGILGEIGDAKGDIGAGAVIGGLGTALVGVNPIFGAFMGAGLGFMYKSTAFQNFLFGEEDENGKRKHQKAYDFMMKEVPAIGKGAGFGMAAGIFMGSPILGAFLGGATGFMLSNEKFQNFLFGEKDKDGNRKGGVLANKIFANVDNTFHNIGNRVTRWLKDLGSGLKDKITGLFDKIKEKSKDENSLFGKLFGENSKIGKTIIGALQLPFKAVGGVTGFIDKRVAKGNLKGGYSTFNKARNRNMTAEERIKARNKFGLKDNDFNNFDKFLASIKDRETLDRYKDLITDIKVSPNGSPEQQEAINSLLNDPDYKAFIGNKSGKELAKLSKFFKKNSGKLSDLVKDETNRKGLQTAEEIRAEKQLTLIDRIAIFVESIATHKDPKDIPGSEKIFGASEKTITEQVYDSESGKIITITRDANGNKIISNENKENSEILNEKRGFKNIIKSIPDRISTLGSGLKTIIFGDGATKEGIFGKAKSFISTIFSKVVKPIIGIGIAIGGMYLLVKSLFGGQGSGSNKFINYLGSIIGWGKPSFNSEDLNGMPNDNGGTKTQFVDSNGNMVTANFDESGAKYYTDSNGNVVNPDEVSRVKAGADTLLTSFRKGTFRQLVLGKPTLVGKFAKGAINKLPKGTKALSIMAKIKESLGTLLKNLDKFPLIPANVKAVLPDCFSELCEKIGTKVSALANNISDYIPILNIVVAVSDFITGYEDARSTLGITAEPTTAQRIISGLVRLIKNLIPFVGPFIPDSLVINIFCKYIAPVFGLSGTQLMQQREEAKQEVAEYNAEHGTNYSVTEYNKAVLNDYTFTERIGNTFKTAKQNISDNITNMKAAYSAAGGGLNGIIDAMKAFSLPKDGIVTKAFNLVKYAITGKLNEFVKEGTLSTFDDSKSENGVKSSTFSKIIGSLPLLPLKITLIPVAIVGRILRPVTEKIGNYILKLKENFDATKEDIKELYNASQEGDIERFYKHKKSIKEDSSASMLRKLTTDVVSVFLQPFTLFHMVTNTIKSKVEEKTKPLLSDYNLFSSYKDNIDKYAEDGDMFSISTLAFGDTTSSFGGMFKIGAFIYQKFGIAKAIYNKIMGWLESIWGGSTASNLVSDIQSKTEQYGVNQYVTESGELTSEGVTYANTEIDKATENAESDTIKDLLQSVKDQLSSNSNSSATVSNNGSGSGLRGKATGLIADNCTNCSGFVSQIDDRYRNIKFGNSTVGENGCGPAVAAMASTSMGGNLDMYKAIDAAKPYTNSAGTSTDYFKDQLYASEIKGVNTVKSALESGRPVILLGRDASNTSKTKSPFGPNNHYVLATGYKNGKVLINDPENDSPMIYDSSILNRSNVNLTYGGYSMLRGKGYGTGVTKSSTSDTVWNTLKDEGFSDAAAAGILGNAQQESSMSTTADAAAYGLFQFEKSTGAADGLTTYANNLGLDKNDAATQTNYMLSLFKDQISTYSGKTYTYNNGTETWWPTKLTYDDYKGLTDAEEAAEIFERTYERPSIPMREQRKHYAADFYDLYNGTGSSSSNSSSSNNQSSSGTIDSTTSDSSNESESSGGLLSTLSTIFGSLTNIFNLNGFSMNGDTSSTSDSTSNDGSAISKAVNFVNSNTEGAQGAQAAANAASNEIGYAETGNNITKFGAWSGCDGQPWCAAFAAWAIAQAFDGSKDKAVKALYDCDNVNYTPTLTTYFKNNNAWYSTPQVGDEVMYGNPGAYHVGLVTSVNNEAGTYESVEGNTNDQVTLKSHDSFMDGNVIGYGRPDYSGATATVSLNNNTNSNAISGNEDFKATGSGLLRGGSSGLLRRAAPSRFAYGSMKGQKFSFGKASGLVSANRFGSNSSIKSTVANTLSNIKTSLTKSNGNVNGIDPALVTELLASITSLLDSIANNTAPTERIYNALVEYIDYAKGNKTGTSGSGEQVTMPTSNDEVDSNLAGLVSTLAAIARG